MEKQLLELIKLLDHEQKLNLINGLEQRQDDEYRELINVLKSFIE